MGEMGGMAAGGTGQPVVRQALVLLSCLQASGLGRPVPRGAEEGGGLYCGWGSGTGSGRSGPSIWRVPYSSVTYVLSITWPSSCLYLREDEGGVVSERCLMKAPGYFRKRKSMIGRPTWREEASIRLDCEIRDLWRFLCT